jgi:anti-anti-sigma factor
MTRPSPAGVAMTASQAGPVFDSARVVQGGASHLALWGEVDLRAMTALEREIALALEGTIDSLVLDLSAVTFLDASGLAAVLRAHERCQRRGVELRILRGEG